MFEVRKVDISEILLTSLDFSGSINQISDIKDFIFLSKKIGGIEKVYQISD